MGPDSEVDIMRTKYNDAVINVKDPDELAAAFKDTVREFSADTPEMVRVGGALGWAPAGIHKDYDHVIFNLNAGRLGDAVQDIDVPSRTLFFMVSDIDEDREISAQNRSTLKTGALQDWLNRERDNHDVHADFNSEVLGWVVLQTALTSGITPTPQPDNPLLRNSSFLGR